jgi:hypothetical protein
LRVGTQLPQRLASEARDKTDTNQVRKPSSTTDTIVLAWSKATRNWLKSLRLRWLQTRGIEAYVIYPTSIPVSREHRRAKTDRLDAGLLMRALLSWLRGEPKHCSMAAIPTITEEEARCPKGALARPR